jgi:hypothetical protein
MHSQPRNTTDTLEPRLLLASPATSEYYPLTPTSHWEYSVAEEDGGSDTLNVKVARGTRRVNKEDARRVIYSDGSDDIQTFQNFNEKGQLHVHGGLFEDADLDLQPPITLPARLRPGVVKRTRGDIDVEIEGFEGDGNYTATVRVGKERQITVPAGTFSAVRVRVDLAFEAEDEILFGEGPEADGHVTHVMWLAKGVGVVRAEQSYEVEADLIVDNEKRSGSSVQQLRSYTIAPASAEKARASVFAVATEPARDKVQRARERADILK